MFQKLQKHQKINQFPRSNELTRKDLLVKRIQKMQEIHGLRNFDFLPKTFTLPHDFEELKTKMDRNPFQYWIVKPIGSSQGKGITITNKISDIQCRQNHHLIASHYVDNPLLIDGLKSDLRIYVALTSVNPLRIYMYEEGLTRFATT